jgi:hypothetical protein
LRVHSSPKPAAIFRQSSIIETAPKPIETRRKATGKNQPIVREPRSLNASRDRGAHTKAHAARFKGTDFMKTTIIAAALALGLAVPAFAQDAKPAAPAATAPAAKPTATAPAATAPAAKAAEAAKPAAPAATAPAATAPAAKPAEAPKAAAAPAAPADPKAAATTAAPAAKPATPAPATK